MVDEQRSQFFISPKYGFSGTLRITRALSEQFPGKTVLHGRATTGDGNEWPVLLNVVNRTLDGLKDWLRSLPKERECRSFCVCVECDEPLRICITPSDTAVPPEGDDVVESLRRPTEGLL